MAQEINVLHSALLKIYTNQKGQGGEKKLIGSATGITFNEGFNIVEAKGIGDFFPKELVTTGGTIRATTNFFYIENLSSHPMTTNFLKRNVGLGANGQKKFKNNQMFRLNNVAIEVYKIVDDEELDENGDVIVSEEVLFSIEGLTMESNDWSINVDQMLTGSATFRGKKAVVTDVNEEVFNEEEPAV